MATIPDYYFQALDANPEANKFEELQKAHKHPELSYFNTNHTITDAGNGKANVEKDELFKRFEKTGIKVYDRQGVAQSIHWNKLQGIRTYKPVAPAPVVRIIE